MRASTIVSLCAVAAVAGSALAQPVTPTALSLGTSGPFFAPFYGTSNTSNLTWFTFTITSPTVVDIDINRTAAPTDLVASLYAGDITGVDAASYILNYTIMYDATFGPLTFIALEDDSEDDAFGGPYGDPRFTLNLPAGTYSLVVTAYNPGGEFTITSNVPTPAAASLLGLGGMVALRRRR